MNFSVNKKTLEIAEVQVNIFILSVMGNIISISVLSLYRKTAKS